MQAPLRLLQAFRTTVEPGLIVATAVSTIIVMATPQLLPDVIDEFDVDTGAAGLVSASQLLGFVLATWGAGRFASASPRAFVVSCLVLALSGAGSALAPTFGLLVAARGASGLALGALTWLAWSEVFGDTEKQGDVSVIGPIAGVVGAPLIGLVLAGAGFRWLYAALAVLSLAPLARIPDFAAAASADERGSRNRPVAAAVVIIAALGLLTAGGSATFVYAGVIAREEIGMGAVALALLFAANALVGIPSARWRCARPLAGLPVVAVAGCAVLVAVSRSEIVFGGALVAWGFLFWAGVPGIFTLLSERSRHPAERAGDAQAVMAAGRVVGPLIGGAAVGAGSFTTLGVTSALMMGAGGVLALTVETRRPVARSGPSRAPVT